MKIFFLCFKIALSIQIKFKYNIIFKFQFFSRFYKIVIFLYKAKKSCPGNEFIKGMDVYGQIQTPVQQNYDYIGALDIVYYCDGSDTQLSGDFVNQPSIAGI